MTEQDYENLLGPDVSAAARDTGRTAPPMPAELVDAIRVLVAGQVLLRDTTPRDAA